MSFKNTDIGLIPSEWDFDTIGDSLYIKGRIGWKGLKKSEYIDRSDYRIINGSNVVNNNIDWFGCGYISEERYEESPEIMLKPNDIVMTKDGTIGKLAIIRSLEQKTTVASGLFVIRVEDNSIDVDYLYYYFSSFYFKELVKSRIEGSVIPHLYQKDLVALKLPLPDLSEQKAISKVLRTLDDKIDVNNQINKTLENMAQAIFKQWFVDFEFPNEDGEPYKSSGGEMVESELGMIPKGWEVKELGEIIDIHDSKRIPLSKKEREKREKIYPYYGAASLMDYVDEYIFDGIYVLLGEDGTVINEDGSPVLQYVWGKFWVNNHAHVLTGKLEDSVNFLYILLKSTNIRSAVTGAVQLKINQKNLCSIKIVLPKDTTLISKYISITDHIFKKYRAASEENEVLTKLRNSLLPKLMSGEIRVPMDEEGDLS